ncbi:MAG: hypothetical protein R3Y12_08570 [Clostridia bacterium]
MNDFLIAILNEQNYSVLDFPKSVAVIYKVENNILMRLKNFSNFRGKMLGITDLSFSINKNLKKILSDIIFEYRKFNFSGIFLDFKGESQSEFVLELDELCFKEKIPLYVPQSYAYVVNNAKIVINTAISGGCLKNIIEYAQMQYGTCRICVQISLVACEFKIPSKNNAGKFMNFPINTNNSPVFFSETLCTNYFTKMDSENSCIFTIFDDKTTFYKKLSLLNSLNVAEIFFDYIDIENTNFTIS